MKKSKKVVIWVLILLITLLIGFNIIYTIINDKSRLTPQESEWVNNNQSKILNISVLNNVNVFGSNGKGIFYDFLNDFSENYSLKINSITYNQGENASGISFGISNSVKNTDINFYQDHFILVSKSGEMIRDETNILEKKIGVLSEYATYVKDSLNESPALINYESKNTLVDALEKSDINFMIVPRIEFLDIILSKNYRIDYHFSNIKRYYNLTLDEKNEPNYSNVLKKYFISWQKKTFMESLYTQEFNLFIKSLSISQTEVDKLQSVVYNYGFINNSPYEILTGGSYGGIIATYLNEFSQFSKVDFNFKRFSNYKKLVNAIQDNKIDLYFGYQNFTTPSTNIESNLMLTYDVLMPESESYVVTSWKSLTNKTVLVENNSLLQSKLTNNPNFQLETYEGEKGLREVSKKKQIIVMDHNLSEFYQKNILKDYTVRYTGYFNTNYVFKSHANETFNKLFNHYIDYLDEKEMLQTGFFNHTVTLKNGTILGTLARYFLLVLGIILAILFLIYRSSKKVRLAKKIRKEDKMKFIDQLTSLKNRNYLNENISKWNKNTIYPQTMIVLDLNRIQEINDRDGYEKGDSQIKAAANILIKMQLDNSDIIRTDGNEFMIYLIGYQAKQITSYIHKLSKEFRNLPYDYGVCIGYSMIMDDIKSIEDAINEATIDVKKQKESQKEDRNYD